MSETVPTPVNPPVTPTPAPSTGNVASALGSMGIGAALGVVVTYGFSLAHVVLPSDVSIAMVTLISAVGHYLQDKYST